MCENGNDCRQRRPVAAILIAMGMFLVTAISAGATIINVPDDFPTIQEGIDAATHFDTVLVAPGHYVENVDFQGKYIVLSSHFLYEMNTDYIFNTIIDGSSPSDPNARSTVRIIGNSGYAATLQGFTITGGTGTLYQWQPGSYDRQGGGVNVQGIDAIIQYNYIHGNEALDDEGIYSAGGGGLSITYGTNAKVLNNIIVNNGGHYGGGMCMQYSTGEIKNNIIAYNYGGDKYSGTGIQKNRGGATLIVNNTIIRNTSPQEGAGIRIFSATAAIINNLLWYNEAPSHAQIYGYTSTYYCNVQGGEVSGTGNIDIEPHLTGDLFSYSRDDCPNIDVGNPDAAYNDIEHPDNPGTAKWPSFGDLRSDIGAYGGPGAFPFHLVGIYADTTVGWAPLEVNFEAHTGLNIDSWHWDFGNGDTSVLQNPTYTYTDRGRYDVTIETDISGGDTYSNTREEYIIVLADSLKGETVEVQSGPGVVFPVSAVNTVPLNEITIPIQYSGDLDLTFDSFSTAGCRTEYFEDCEIVALSVAAKTLTLRLAASDAGTQPPLDPGEGPVVTLHFTVASGAVMGQTTTVLMDGYDSHLPEFAGSVSYAPRLLNGTIVASSCCGQYTGGMTGNTNCDIDGKRNLADISKLIDRVYLTKTPLCCEENGNVNGDVDGKTNLADISRLIDHVYLTKDETSPCL